VVLNAFPSVQTTGYDQITARPINRTVDQRIVGLPIIR
jgi:hypothetical protein